MTKLTMGFLCSVAAMAMSQPASAQQQSKQSDLETAEDVVMQPAEDLNLKKNEIPEILIAIAENPYSLNGISSCGDVRRAVSELNDVLGNDLDSVEEDSDADKRRRTAGSVGKSIVGGLIPFRGIVREITGAAGDERRMNQALYAGAVRRGFLKGIGQQKGCTFPAAPNTDKSAE